MTETLHFDLSFLGDEHRSADYTLRFAGRSYPLARHTAETLSAEGLDAPGSAAPTHLARAVVTTPATTYHESIRDEQAKLLRTIRPLNPANLVRGQYRGYRSEHDVARDSNVETFAAVRLHIDT